MSRLKKDEENIFQLFCTKIDDFLRQIFSIIKKCKEILIFLLTFAKNLLAYGNFVI